MTPTTCEDKQNDSLDLQKQVFICFNPKHLRAKLKVDRPRALQSPVDREPCRASCTLTFKRDVGLLQEDDDDNDHTRGHHQPQQNA